MGASADRVRTRETYSQASQQDVDGLLRPLECVNREGRGDAWPKWMSCGRIGLLFVVDAVIPMLEQPLDIGGQARVTTDVERVLERSHDPAVSRAPELVVLVRLPWHPIKTVD